ncbi:MAG: methyltransferase domain-containing protein [Chloroflexi bacterium]|nr:methyltransferase domain-containing protein [Chloroflexota bacterium]
MTDSRRSVSQIDVHFPPIVDRESRLNKARKIAAVLRDFGNGLTGQRILDIGTGSGTIAAHLAEHARFVVGIDVVDERLETNVPFLLIGDEGLPFKAHSFDIVVSNHLIDHVEDQEKHLWEIHRVLDEGGVTYLAVFNRYALIEPHYGLPLLSWLPEGGRNFYLGRVKGRQYNVIPIALGRLTRLALSVGFEVEDVSLDLVKNPERYAMGNGRVTRWLSLFPRWLVALIRPLFPSFVLLLRKLPSNDATPPEGLR